MTCFKKYRGIAYVSILLIAPCVYAVSGNDANPVSIDVTTRINYVRPSCNVNVVPKYDLGQLVKGEITTHSDLSVQIQCQHIPDIFTSLTASSSAKTVTSSSQKLQLMNGNDHAWLSLTDFSSGQDVDVSFDNVTRFCSTIQNTIDRSCDLKVRTQIEAGNTTVGAFSVPVTFSLVYL